MQISSLVQSLLKQHIAIVYSWGFHNPIALDKGLRFSVQGFIHKGMVEILYDEGQDSFSIKLLDADGGCVCVANGIAIDSLVDIADSMIEYCPDYKQRVQDEYGVYFPTN